MRTIEVVGAGFSGLTLAYHLRRRGLDVRVSESQARAGGLLATEKTEFGLVEPAANAVLAEPSMLELFRELNVPVARGLALRRRRYVFWKRPRRWPLPLGTSARLLRLVLGRAVGAKFLVPEKNESVAAWARRVVDTEFERRLLSPALQGIYAGDPERLSARLTMRAFLLGERRAPSMAPKQGMCQLTEALRGWLESNGVQFEFGREFALSAKPENPVVLCTSAWTAARLVESVFPDLAARLARCESLPLMSVTAFFEPHKSDPRGFGCLFPRGQGVRALGVMFNNCIFAGRSKLRSETWIYGGALDPAAAGLSDQEVAECLAKDRARLTGGAREPRSVRISRHPRALPHYTLDWEAALRGLEVPRPLFLHGNYLGQLGLANIHQRSLQLAEMLGELYGE
jgi:oxygen-dependent protoporphyrinogen oxidase